MTPPDEATAGDGVPREPARDRAARVVTEALESGRIGLCRSGGRVLASFGGADEVPVDGGRAVEHRAIRRRLRDLHVEVEGAQPADRVLRVMLDVLASAAERLAPPEPEAAREGEDESGDQAEQPLDGDAQVKFVKASGSQESQADLLVRLAEEADVELWHTPGGDLYATTIEEGRAEHRPLESRDLKRWLRRRFYEEYEKALVARR